MEIRQIIDTEINHYRHLVGLSGTIFNMPEWLGNFHNKIQIYGIYDDDGQLLGGFHLFIDRFYFFRHIKNPPFTPNCGLFFSNIAKNKSKKSSFEKSIMSVLSEFIKDRHPGITTIGFPSQVIDMQHFYWKNFKVIPNYTYQINLKLEEEEIFSTFSPERRNDIKKAQRDNLKTSEITDYSIIKELVIKTFDRQKDSIPISILDKILYGFANPTNSVAIIVSNDNKVIAGIFCVYDRRSFYYLLGGYDSLNRHSGAVALAIWEAIKRAKATGASIFDFEGSMIPNVEKFFRDFGGDLIPYFTINKALMPAEILLKFIKRNRF
jgi:hypothetical protein